MKVHTKVGEIVGPDPNQVHPRVKYWAEAMVDLIKCEELFCVMGAALEEAYHAGRRDQFMQSMNKYAGRGEVIDADFRVVEEGSEGSRERAEGSEHSEPVGPDPGSGPVESPSAPVELPGSVPEVPDSQRGDEEEVAPPDGAVECHCRMGSDNLDIIPCERCLHDQS